MAGGWPGPRRKLVATKLTDDERAPIDQRARNEGLLWNGQPNTADMIRVMCAYATEHMPPGWRPPTP